MSTSENFDDDAISANCNVIVIFANYEQFRAIRRRIPDVWSVILTFPLKVSVYLAKSRTKKSPTQLSYYCFE